MKLYKAVTGLYVGFVPGFPGAHFQAETLDELQKNLHEVCQTGTRKTTNINQFTRWLRLPPPIRSGAGCA